MRSFWILLKNELKLNIQICPNVIESNKALTLKHIPKIHRNEVYKLHTIFQRTEISEPTLFSPSDTTKRIADFPEICVSTFSDNIIRKFSSLDNVEKIAELCSANGTVPVYRIYYKNTAIAFYRSMVGAPACVCCFEEIVAMGAKKFVLFGSCGVLDSDKVKDSIIIPVSAVRDEGTSYHYLAPSPEIGADARAVELLEKILTDCGYSYVKGKTWTSDAIYRETLSAIEERRQEGCLAVEMECASMLAVSKYRHIPFIQFLYGADDLSSETWEIRDLMSYGLTNAEKYMALAFECGLAM